MTVAHSNVENNAIKSFEDILAIEQVPNAECLPFSTIEQIVRRLPTFGHRVAISFMPNGDPSEPTEDLTYRELHRQVIQAIDAFRSLGVQATDFVAYLLPSVPEAFITLLAAETLGRACPINYMLSAPIIAEILDAAKAKILVVFGPDDDLDIWSKVDAVRQLSGVEHVVVVSGNRPAPADVMLFADLLAASSDTSDGILPIAPDDICALYHTGGSTGSPKLVQHTHRNQVHCLWLVSRFFDFSENDVIINGHPLFHVAGALNFGIGPLAVGARLLMPSKLGLRNKTFQANVWRIVERHRGSVLIGGPTVITMLLNLDPDGADISTLRLHISGGSTLPVELIAGMEAKFGIPVRNVWGMTETGGLTCLEPARAPTPAGSCGWRLPFTSVAVFPLARDGAVQTATECKPDEVGILAVKGPHVTPGYLDPAHNERSFTPDGWFLTGDLGRIGADRRVYLTGRAKDVIIRGGHNIDPLVIEQALLRHPDIQLCAAVGQPDSYAGEIPVAFVQLMPNADVDLDELIREIRPSFPEPAAIPKRLYRVDHFPTTSTGKILKPALRRMATETAVIEKLQAILPAGMTCDVSFLERGHQDIMQVRLPHEAEGTLVETARNAVASLRIAFEITRL